MKLRTNRNPIAQETFKVLGGVDVFVCETEDTRAHIIEGDCEGGETHFPQAGVRFKGRKGEALVFRNVTPSGAPDFDTLHAGLPPSRGEKWLLSQWVRRRPKRR